MSYRLALVALSLFIAATAAADDIGRAVTVQDMARRIISIPPSGTGLPNGRGDARAGRSLYETHCASCHGAQGEGVGAYPALAGGQGTLTTERPLKTVGSYWPYATTVWDYINRAMPYQNPGALRADEVYSVTAYVLYLNKIVPETQVLDKTSLPRVRMPNRDGFFAKFP